MKKLLIIPLILLINACAGSGYRDRSIHAQEIISTDTLIFVQRDTGYVGSAALIEISHNGRSVSKIGDKESISIPGVVGTNNISAKFTGLAGVGVSNPSKTFELKESEKSYFKILLQQNLFSSELKLYEITQEDFMSD